MTTIYRDDITGEEYEERGRLEQFGIIAEGMKFGDFETTSPESEMAVDNIADELHRMVDDWAADYKLHIEGEF